MVSPSASTVIAYPCCGLANRMRLIVNAVAYAAVRQSRALVVWQPSPISGANFRDIFEESSDFQVVDVPRWLADDFSAPCIEYTSCVRWISNPSTPERRQLRVHKELHFPPAECSAAINPIPYRSILDEVSPGLPAPPDRGAPAVFRGCGVRFESSDDSLLCGAITRRLTPVKSLRTLVTKLMPADTRSAIGVHLRPPDTELDIGGQGPNANPASGRRLSQGRTACHPLALYAEMVADEYRQNHRLRVIYVASGSASHLSSFKHEVLARLEPSRPHFARIGRAMPQLLSLADLLTLPGAPVNRPRPAANGPWVGGGRDTVYGMQLAVLDLWALASTSKVFRSGESTFGMLASAMHRQPSEAVVHNTTDPACKMWSQMFPHNGTSAFCAANRGAQEPQACQCAH